MRKEKRSERVMDGGNSSDGNNFRQLKLRVIIRSDLSAPGDECRGMYHSTG